MDKVFHKLQSDKVEAVLLHGLKVGEAGDKRDAAITTTDTFLNGFCPEKLKKIGLDRKSNIYCYLAVGDKAVDVISGKKRAPQEIADTQGQTILEAGVDPEACYVSDLDLYDEILHQLQNHNTPKARELAQVYWKRLKKLSSYKGGVRRPEVMVTYDIPPNLISKIN